MRDELAVTALGLFLGQGFEATKTEQIPEVADLSKRSFFRYFASKDDVLAHFLNLPGVELAHNLEARDITETPWVALRRSMDPLVSAMMGNPQALAMTRMMLEGDASEPPMRISSVAGAPRSRSRSRSRHDCPRLCRAAHEASPLTR